MGLTHQAFFFPNSILKNNKTIPVASVGLRTASHLHTHSSTHTIRQKTPIC